MVHQEFSLSLESVQELELPTALFKAVADEDVEALSEALESDGGLLRVHKQNHQGNNVLHYGIINGKVKTLEHLIITLKKAEQGFKKVLEQPNGKGCFPISLACMYATNGAAKVLLKHKICHNLETPTPKARMTPLMWTVEHGDAELAVLLLRAGARLGDRERDVHTRRGRSVATLALHRGRLGLLGALLRAGYAEQLLFQMDGEGRTAAQWAVAHDRPRALQLLLDAKRATGSPFIDIEEQIEKYKLKPEWKKKKGVEDNNLVSLAVKYSPMCLRLILDKVNEPLEGGSLRDEAIEKLGWMYVAMHDAPYRCKTILTCGRVSKAQVDLTSCPQPFEAESEGSSNYQLPEGTTGAGCPVLPSSFDAAVTIPSSVGAPFVYL